ncbi:phosphatase PAP2 family protein [Bifidobacterium choloepi]|nr:phosphatase PAP2 family protein [Bifidobacterium choloepi]
MAQQKDESPKSGAPASGDSTSGAPAPLWQPIEERHDARTEVDPSADASVSGGSASDRSTGQPGPDRSVFTDESLGDDLDEGLAQVDPLANRPRVSSIVLCAVFAVLFAALAALAYWLGIRTVTGQSYEDEVITTYAGIVPDFLAVPQAIVGKSAVVIAAATLLGLIALLVVLVRRRWWLLGQLIAFAAVCFIAAKVLKPLLPRPFLINVESSTVNSAPSGHTMLAAAAGLALLCAVPHAWRAACAVISTLVAVSVGCSVIVDQWHRPVDVIMAMLITGALMMVALAFTRGSGMDRPGQRVSSPSIQIVAAALITGGLCCWAYAAYIIWQIQIGLQLSASWTASGAASSATALVVGTACVVNGMVLMMRQITAAPLTRLGLLGAPPAPPRR